jgi:methionyl-tRNA formyltransferase
MIIGYFADGPWAHRALNSLLAREDIKVAFICARSDVPDMALEVIAQRNNIPFLIPQNVNDDAFIGHLKKYGCDLFVSMSFNQIFKKVFIDLPPRGVINCHAGKLPFYRGRNVLNWALINDEQEFGVTVHFVDEGIDSGDIILQKCFEITEKDTYGSLLERAYEACSELLIEAISDIIKGNVKRQTQSSIHPFGSYCSSRGIGDEKLSWNQSSRQVFNFVRAISLPGPLARCYIDLCEFKIIAVEYIPEAPSYIGFPGAVLGKDVKGFLVKTGDSYVRLVAWEADIKLKVGDRFQS